MDKGSIAVCSHPAVISVGTGVTVAVDEGVTTSRVDVTDCIIVVGAVDRSIMADMIMVELVTSQAEGSVL